MITFIFGVLTLSALAQNITPNGASIHNWSLSGDGCDMESVTVSLSPEAQELSFLFDSYISEIGPASSQPFRNELIKNCRILINMNIPSGWQMAFKSVDYRGFASLPQRGSSAFHRLSVMQQGAPIVSLREAAMVGPMNDDYFLRAEISPQRLTWSTCLSGRTQVQIYSQLGVRKNLRAEPLRPEEALTIAIDSSDVSMKQSLGVEWRRCGNVGSGGGSTRPNPPGRPPRYRP